METTKWTNDAPNRVLFAFCIVSRGTVSLKWAMAFRGIILPMNTGAIPVIFQDEVGGEIAECRNAVVEVALRSGATHLFWLDDDVCVDNWALAALHRHAVPMSSGVYFTKNDFSDPLIFPASGGGTSPFMGEGTSQAHAAGMGLVLIHADVYRRMSRKLPLGKDKNGHVQFYRTVSSEEATERDRDDAGGKFVNYGSTEDFYFFDRAAEAGFTLLIDHSQKAFGWHVDRNTLKGYPAEQYAQHVAGKEVVWDTPAGKKIWK